MSTVNYLPQLAVKGNVNRKKAIESILSKNGIGYSIIGATTQNIVVSLCPDIKKRIVIGAHYDAFSEYIEAANDNAAACVILMNLILSLRNNTDRGYDFVFFDGEDSKPPVWKVYGREVKWFVGSMKYISAIGKENIEAMINLDMCGMGGNMVLKYQSHNIDLLNTAPYSDIIKNCQNVVDDLPDGDSTSFGNSGISNIFIINSTDHDLPFFRDMKHRMHMVATTDFFRTMHKPSDTVGSFSADGMEGILGFMKEYL